MLLKRAEDAIADGDDIYAVIKGWGINNDGHSKMGYTAPSVDGQSAAISMAHRHAGVLADSITYVEAHGTGTSLGDPIEVDSLTKAFRQSTDKKQFCAIGSVKSNIGHLDVTAGVTALIKNSLVLRNRLIPPSLNYERPNPNIDFANSPFYVVDQPQPWTSATPRPCRLELVWRRRHQCARGDGSGASEATHRADPATAVGRPISSQCTLARRGNQ